MELFTAHLLLDFASLIGCLLEPCALRAEHLGGTPISGVTREVRCDVTPRRDPPLMGEMQKRFQVGWMPILNVHYTVDGKAKTNSCAVYEAELLLHWSDSRYCKATRP